MIELPQSLKEHKHIRVGDAYYFPNMPNNVYHNTVGISSSTIRKFGKSQIHALKEEMEDSHALRFGSAAHAMIVEGEDVFNQEVACLVGSPYTSANKQLKKDYEDKKRKEKQKEVLERPKQLSVRMLSGYELNQVKFTPTNRGKKKKFEYY